MEKINDIANFQCHKNEVEEIPQFVVDHLGMGYAPIYSEHRTMADAAEMIMQSKQDVMCKIPFCVTIEAEALGATVTIMDSEVAPTLGEYHFKTIESLADIKPFDFSKGRILEVLRCIEDLNQRGHVVTLKVEAPFTILGLLVDITSVYKNLHCNISLIEHALEVITDGITKYIELALDRGVKIISYADPSGGVELVGPEVFKRLSGFYTNKILRRITPQIEHGLVHLCGRTSFSLEKTGFCRVAPIRVHAGTYGEALCEMIERQDVKIIGHNCLQITRKPLTNPTIIKIDLC